LKFLGIAFVLALIGCGASTAGAISTLLPVEHLEIDGKFTPARISATHRTPVTLEISETVSTEDGSHLKPLQEVTFEFDRHLRLDLEDIPRCHFSTTQDIPTDWEKCGRARIGGGTVEWEVAFPEEEPFRTGGRALLYKTGPKTMLLRSWVNFSSPTEVWTLIDLGKGEGIYRLEAVASIPKIAGGSGSLTHLGLRFHKGLFSATCPRRNLQLSVFDRFLDGVLFKGRLFRPCERRG
jgi:hypothetical protein